MSAIVLMVILGLGIIVVPFAVQLYADSYVLFLLMEFAGAVLFIASLYLELRSRFFQIALSNEAVVRTGGFGTTAGSDPQVAIGKGNLVYPCHSSTYSVPVSSVGLFRYQEEYRSTAVL